MSRTAEIFSNEKAFIGYITAGDPTIEKTEEFILEMAQAGADALELGIPFSDPIAQEGLHLEASIRAIENGCTTDKVFDMIQRVRTKTAMPIILSAYANTLYKYGYKNFCTRCKESRVDGILVPDMPYEERKELEPYTEEYGIDFVTVIAPASKERICQIAQEAQGVIYALPAMPENGTKGQEGSADAMLEWVREVTDKPVVVSTGCPESVCVSADGMVEENELVALIARHGQDGASAIHRYLTELR